MMACRHWEEPIHLLVGGQLGESAKPALLRHLEQCEKCRAFCQDLREIETALRAPVSEKDLLSGSEIRMMVERSLVAAERRPIPVRHTSPTFAGLRIAWGFAALVLVFFGGYFFHALDLGKKMTPSPQVASIPNSGSQARPPEAKPDSAQVRPSPQTIKSKTGRLPYGASSDDHHYEIAGRLIKKRNFAAAAAALQKYLALHTVKRDKAMLDLGYCYSMLGQPQKALPIYQAVVKGSRNPQAVATAYHEIDSLLNFGRGDYANANDGVRAYLRAVPGGNETYYLIQMPVRNEDSAKVDCLLEQVRQEFPQTRRLPGTYPQAIQVGSPRFVSQDGQ